MSLVLYGLPLSPFYRKAEAVLLAKGLEYEAEAVNIMPMPDWFKEISPAHRIPVLRDTSIAAEGKAGTIADSSAICAYLEKLQPEPSLYPDDAYAHARAVWYEEFSDSELAGQIGMGIFRPIAFAVFQKKDPDLATAKKTRDEKLPRLFDYLEDELAHGVGSNGHLVGDALSIADIAVVCQLTQMALVIGPPDAGRWPGLRAHYDRVTALPCFASNLEACRRIVPKPFDLD